MDMYTFDILSSIDEACHKLKVCATALQRLFEPQYLRFATT